LSSPVLLEAAEFLLDVLKNCQTQREARTKHLKDAYPYFPYAVQGMNYPQSVLSVGVLEKGEKKQGRISLL